MCTDAEPLQLVYGGLRRHLKQLEVTDSLISCLESHLSGIPDNGGSHRVYQDPPGEVCTEQTAGAHQPCREPVDVSPAMSPSASQTPLVKQPLHLASTVSPDLPDSTFSRCQHGRAVPCIPGPQPHSLWHCLLRRRV
ncbi:hypothetical protein MC885_005558 [Smutsia gigantea]|nr:hypothetical protein MC885_005558 [Smutsia gigantea]